MKDYCHIDSALNMVSDITVHKFFLLLLLPLLSCRSELGAIDSYESTRIEGLPGPEDIVLDDLNPRPRLLISSTDRRHGEKRGQIYALDLRTDTVQILPRRGEPQGLSFHPHGIDLVRDMQGKAYLYVITHREEEPDKGRARPEGPAHAVVRYELFPDRLEFRQLYEDPLLVSPNDLSARPDGSIYVSNDSSKKGGLFELVFALKRSNVVYFNGSSWIIAASSLAMANGIVALDDRVYVAVTREHKTYQFTPRPDGSLGDKKILARVRGPDNLTLHKGDLRGDEGGSDRVLLVAAHEKDMALMRHMSSSSKKSPTAIYSVGLLNGAVTPVFKDNGSRISAGSVAVMSASRLYIGQIMDPFILGVQLK